MKELSIEEKAKAYDEALKVLHKYDGANIMFSQSLKDEMFPELREESDDEKIRGAILHFISHTPTVPKGHISKKDMIAWLEKQGEHANFINKIKIGDKVTRNEDGVLVNLSQLKRVAKKDEKQGEQKPADKQFTPEQASVLDKHIDKFLEQKPYASETMNEKGDFDNGFTRMMEKEQKPAWSEEDEEIKKKVMHSLSLDGRINNTELTDIYNWLKSLKDRYTWKPSDEQLKALKHASNDCSIAFADMKILATLYEQLKALHRYEQDT